MAACDTMPYLGREWVHQILQLASGFFLLRRVWELTPVAIAAGRLLSDRLFKKALTAAAATDATAEANAPAADTTPSAAASSGVASDAPPAALLSAVPSAVRLEYEDIPTVVFSQ